jgi:hypothetical protein
MELESTWNPPKDAYVEVDGDICPVPVIDDDIVLLFTYYKMEIIQDGALDNCSNWMNSSLMPAHIAQLAADWLKSLSDAEVEGGTVYFLDRWTWDSGHDNDLLFGRLFEKERKRRNKLRDIICSR